MASQPDDDAGPSGLAQHEVLATLGLETSDSEKEEETTLLTPEEMACRDEDEICQEALNRFERQHQFQTHLLQQSGAGGLDTSVETSEFELQPYVDRLSNRLGVRERHFNTRLRQRGNFIEDQNITEALQDGLRRAVNQVLATTPNHSMKSWIYECLYHA